MFAENGSFFTNAYSGLYFDLLMDGTYSPIDVDSVNLTPIDEEGEMPFILTGISFPLKIRKTENPMTLLKVMQAFAISLQLRRQILEEKMKIWVHILEFPT